MIKWFFVFSLFARLALASPLSERAVWPQYDSFYEPPSGWESRPNGAILKTRSITPATASVVLNVGVDGTQLLYKTSGPAGEALATVVTVLRPFGAKADRLLSYAFAEDSNNDKCAPSYNRK
jgi:hypothetical protein